MKEDMQLILSIHMPVYVPAVDANTTSVNPTFKSPSSLCECVWDEIFCKIIPGVSCKKQITRKQSEESLSV